MADEIRTQTYQRKVTSVDARQHVGPKLTVVSHDKGEQTAHDGDYLVGTERFHVIVVPKDEFERDYEVTRQAEQDHVEAGRPEPLHFDTHDEAEAFIEAKIKPGSVFEYRVGDDPAIVTVDKTH